MPHLDFGLIAVNGVDLSRDAYAHRSLSSQFSHYPYLARQWRTPAGFNIRVHFTGIRQHYRRRNSGTAAGRLC
jgi:hypothetical protein